jgi:predicted nucleotidyltransferase
MASLSAEEQSDVAAKLREALSGRTDIEVAVLFGSQARGRARVDSDVDMAIVGSNVDLLALQAELSLRLAKELHVVRLVDVDVPMLHDIVQEGILVHEGVPGAAASWRSRALLALAIDLPWYARMRDAWLKRVAARGV